MSERRLETIASQVSDSWSDCGTARDDHIQALLDAGLISDYTYQVGMQVTDFDDEFGYMPGDTVYQWTNKGVRLLNCMFTRQARMARRRRRS